MDDLSKEALQALMRSGVAKAIMDQVPYIVLYEDVGMGAACLCKVSDIKQVLAYNPDKEFVILCTIKADGEIQEATGTERLKHTK